MEPKTFSDQCGIDGNAVSLKLNMESLVAWLHRNLFCQ